MAGKAFFFGLFASLLILSFSPLIVKPTAAQQTYVNVTVSQAKVMIDTESALVILDVRNQSEYDTGHIRNAKLIPVWNLTQNLDELNQTDEILVYCSAGVRSANASSILDSNGFLHVYNMFEGINGWLASGYPEYVDYSSTYASFPSIQAAIDYAAEGQTIYVGNGFYNETLLIDKPLTLLGENASTTIINETATILHVNADNVSISDFTIQYIGCACFGYSSINVTNCQNVNVTSSIVISDDFGIEVAEATNVVVANNDFTHAGSAAIVVMDSDNVSVFNNNVAAMNGIQIENCTEGSFSSNTILSSETGVFIAQSYGDTLSGNNVSSITSMGLWLSSCSNNSFFGNNVSTTSPYGLFIWLSYNNTIFDNNFPGNGSQILCYDNSTNTWDNGLEGNYWSNYTGVDTDLNGIGDTPYIIDSTNRDDHPLMGPFQSFNTAHNSDVNIVSNSSINEFEYDAPNRTITLQVSNTTTNQTIGFCRISIPHSLINPNNGSISVIIDNGQTPVLFLNNTLYDDRTNRWIYFTYQLTTHSVSVISVSEFPVLSILALFMITTIMTIVIYKKRQVRA